nr:MAG TPA: hypothetical protein [Crassvirales sp.]DAS01523.1 MAG TPA: hypothetical protein [Caudoviricetes sp.]
MLSYIPSSFSLVLFVNIGYLSKDSTSSNSKGPVSFL